jgi:gliding motility-associated-like protein
VKLLEKLKKDKQYYISFYVSKKNCSNPDICYSDGMALAFSDTLFQKQLPFGIEYLPDYTPAVENPSGNMLTDTLDWTEIGGCYTAKGAEEYAIIGNFRSAANTNSAGCVGGTGSYYYIDDVGVYEFDPLPDTLLLCGGETKDIGSTFLNGTYQWNTGATDSTIVVSEAGRYIVTIDLGKCSLSDTVFVIEMDEVINYLFTDTLICSGDLVQLSIPIPGVSTWSNGAQGNNIVVSEADIYSVSISNECGLFSHSFDVESEICECNVFIPNAFSPNYDGVNDYLECFVSCDFPFKAVRFQVFNRWGALVYASHSADNQAIRWDGTLRGEALGPGVYIWIFEYEYTRKGKVVNKMISGDVTIVR